MPIFSNTEEQLEWEMNFIFGDLLYSEWTDPRSLARLRRTPDQTLLCLRKGDNEFIWGDEYLPFCKLCGDKIQISEKITPAIIKRNIDVSNIILNEIDEGVPLAICMNDARFFDWQTRTGSKFPVPVFQHHRRIGTKAIILPLPGYLSFPSRYIPKIVDTLTFREKLPKIVWRGGLRGTNLTAHPYRFLYGVLKDHKLDRDEKIDALMSFSRFRLSLESKGVSELDIGFTIGSGQPELRAFDFLNELSSTPLPQVEQIQYKYILALDGNDWPSSLYWSLNTNSVVFREESPWEAFGDNYFLPWRHFVPVQPSIDDLLSKFHWAENNPARCEEIIHNAQHAWRQLFSRDVQAKRRGAIASRYNVEFKNRFAPL